jgi:hypothetical protein
MSRKSNLKYYCFDLDDNLLYLSTMIHLDKHNGSDWIKHSVSTKTYAKLDVDGIKYRFHQNDPKMALSEFTDYGHRKRNALMIDAIDSITKNKYGNSWNNFIECIVSGHLFSIITARSHSPKVIRKLIEFIVYKYLSEKDRNKMIKNLNRIYDKFNRKHTDPIVEYLDKCYYIGVTSKWFINKFKLENVDHTNVEYGKVIAIKYFTKKIARFGKRINANVSLGFSDDSKRNLDKIEKLMKEFIISKYNIKCIIYDTSIKNKTIKKVITSQY